MNQHGMAAALGAFAAAAGLLCAGCSSAPANRSAPHPETAAPASQQTEARQPVAAGAHGEPGPELRTGALQAHQRAQQARDTALAAQLAAKPDADPALRHLMTELAALEIPTESGRRGLVLILEGSHLRQIESAPGPGLAAALGPVIEFLSRHPERMALIQGHGDPSLPPAERLRRSQADAQAVRAALVGSGIAAERVHLQKPANGGDTLPPAPAADRRHVEIVITPPD